jgi:hypothetical protein
VSPGLGIVPLGTKFFPECPNLETRARNPLWRLAEALGNTGDFCTKISTFGSSTPLDIYK